MSKFRNVAQLVEYSVWGREVVGSSPTIPTKWFIGFPKLGISGYGVIGRILRLGRSSLSSSLSIRTNKIYMAPWRQRISASPF